MKDQAFNQNFKYEFVTKLAVHIGMFINGDKVLQSDRYRLQRRKIFIFFKVKIGNLFTLVWTQLSSNKSVSLQICSNNRPF